MQAQIDAALAELTAAQNEIDEAALSGRCPWLWRCCDCDWELCGRCPRLWRCCDCDCGCAVTVTVTGSCAVGALGCGGAVTVTVAVL